jgi:hypothetical protein
MSKPTRARSDLELMEHADGELDDPSVGSRIAHDADAQLKIESIKQIGELVRGHLELSADAVHDAKFAAMWRRIADQSSVPTLGLWARIAAWFDQYRGHVITGAVSAGAVAALALILRPSAPDLRDARYAGLGGAIDVRPVALRATPEVDVLDTPGEQSTVISLDDEDGHTTVIWVSPSEPLEDL